MLKRLTDFEGLAHAAADPFSILCMVPACTNAKT